MAVDVAGFLRQREALIASASPSADAARELSDLADRAVSDLAEAALSQLRSPWAVLALGGWGARRLLPHSDLDLLVLTEAPSAELKPALTDVLYPLWDAGLQLGHQVRSRRDHERAVRESVETLTATLTGRVLCGDAALGQRLLEEVATDAHRRAKKQLPGLVSRARPGSPYLIEPDLKDGAGGQRDLDELAWLGAVLSGRPAVSPDALVEAGAIDGAELACLTAAGDAITAARWALHRQVKRPSSLMTLELAAESGLDMEAVQASLADAHHLLLRVRGRLAKKPAAFDPRCEASAGAVVQPRAALTPEALFALLQAGEESLADLEEAAWAGLLEDVAPSFGALMHVRRPGLSHVFTVGDHCLRAAALIAGLDRERAATSGAPLADPRPLQAAALLHDVGKTESGPGHPGRGAEAMLSLGPRLGLTTAQTADASLLVNEHLLLAQTAHGADIHDEDVLLRTASKVGRRSLVDQLYLLTVADSTATGPGAWTAWDAALVGELADRLKAALSDHVEGTGLVEQAESVRFLALSGIDDRPEFAALADFVRRASLRYLAATSVEEVGRHASLATSVAASGRADAFEVGVSSGPTDETWRVSVASPDRPGLFALICGALSLSGLDIMAADAYAAPGGVALDVFVVGSDTLAAVDTATWSAFERHLRAALVDPAGLAVRLEERRRHYPRRSNARTRVETEPTGAYATAVKVRAADRVGLLYDLARAFADSELQIRWARAVTQDGVAKDVFHVTDSYGEPVDDPGVLGHLAMRIRERL